MLVLLLDEAATVTEDFGVVNEVVILVTFKAGEAVDLTDVTVTGDGVMVGLLLDLTDVTETGDGVTAVLLPDLTDVITIGELLVVEDSGFNLVVGFEGLLDKVTISTFFLPN